AVFKYPLADLKWSEFRRRVRGGRPRSRPSAHFSVVIRDFSTPMEQEETLHFGRFEIRPRQSPFLADGKPVELGSRAFEVLLALVESAGMLVTKSELMERGWPGQEVEENNVQVQIHALRRALGPDRSLIQTVPGRGYRFVGELTSAGP